jgi:hypothetical protein
MLKIDTKSDLDTHVVLGVTAENELIEFKREANYFKEHANEEMALDICQFANSFGGVILYGVDEKLDKKSNKKIASSYRNVDYERLSKFLNDKVIPLIHPKNIRISCNQINIDEQTYVVSINVYPLSNGLACVCNNKPPFSQKYPYRTNYGKKYFNAVEVEKMISQNNRHISIMLHELKCASNEVRLYPSLKKEIRDGKSSWENSEDTIILKYIGKNEYTLNASGMDINIPFSMTQDVWETEENKIGIILGSNIIISSCRKKIYFDIK